MFSVYALYNSEIGKMYIGQTGSLERRIREHNKNSSRNFTTRHQGEWKLIYQESVSTRSEALLREKQLKSYQGRVYLSKYIPS